MPETLARPIWTKSQLARMIDVSAVQASSTEDDVRQIAALAKKYRCVAVFALPSLTPLLKELLWENDSPDPFTRLGGVVGFPGGGETTSMKVYEAREQIDLGCQEIDMVLNVGKMLSGETNDVYNDIFSVRKAIGDVPLKVILECHHLSPDLIAAAANIAVDAGANWIKTGTGWAPTGATLENVALMKRTVGNRAKVKAAGGVRSLETMIQMIELGAERFGIGCRTVLKIFSELEHINDDQS